jgi:parallel beta-helix repeat protein
VKAEGGAVYAKNVNASIHSSTIADNTADGKGGAIALEGSASLTLKGNTSVRGNLATTGGTAIDSSSAGSITISDEAAVEFHADTSAPGMAIVSGGKLEYGPGDAHAYLLAVTLKHSHSHINALVHRYAPTGMRSY